MGEKKHRRTICQYSLCMGMRVSCAHHVRIRTRFGADLTRRTDLASAKIPASCTQKGTVVFGLLKCCRLVGNMQTLVPSGSQLAPTGSIPHGRKNIYYRKTCARSTEKGKTPQSELQLGEIITVVRKKTLLVLRDKHVSHRHVYTAGGKKIPPTPTNNSVDGRHHAHEHQTLMTTHWGSV